MSLQVDYRPKNFKTFFGNKDVISGIRQILKRDKIPPAAFLFTGPGGTGKTTLARIMARALKCSKADFTELNTADDRGIDGIRKVIESMKYSPLNGETKVYLLDECFSANTKITTRNGTKYIKDVLIGDYVQNINGIDIVDNKFKNKVNLGRVVRVNKSDGTHTFCSSDHLFFGEENWQEAKDLAGSYLLCYDSKLKEGNNLQQGSKNEQSNMRGMWGKLSQSKENEKILQQQLFCKMEKSKLQRISSSLFNLSTKLCKQSFKFLDMFKVSNSSDNLFRMWNKIYSLKSYSEILFPNLCSKVEKFRSRNKKENVYQGEESKNKAVIITTKKNRKRENYYSSVFRKNEESKSYAQSLICRKDEEHTKNKWNIKCMAWKTWWKWTINKITEDNFCLVGVGNGNSYIPREEAEGISHLLQDRRGKQKVENCNRIRRNWTQLEKEYHARQKENNKVTRIRVDSVEIYKRGSNDESFKSIIGDKERNQGYVEFYDLQINEHPSYIADGVMVHNCHMLTLASQEALLKALEEPPDYVHFCICTTNPEKLKTTFKRRCHNYELSPLRSSEMQELMQSILEKEKKKKFNQNVLDKIVDLADGSAGVALKLLDMVIDMTDEDRALNTLKSSGATEAEVIDICRVLANLSISEDAKWARIKTLLKDFKGDAESARRPILGYLSKCLIGNGGFEIAVMMDEFKDNFYDSGTAGLVLACYKAIYSMDEDEITANDVPF